MTEWRGVPGWDYEVSDDGQVRRTTPYHNWAIAGRIMKQRLRGHSGVGYLAVKLSHPKKGTRDFPVHRLMLLAFHGPAPEGMQAAHLDGVRTHNTLANLRWVTAKENQSHRKLHGTFLAGESHPNHLRPERLARGERHGTHTHPEARPYGERNAWAKLTEEDVLDILASPLGPVALGRKYGVNYRTIQQVRCGKTWKHVSCPQLTGEIPRTWSHE